MKKLFLKTIQNIFTVGIIMIISGILTVTYSISTFNIMYSIARPEFQTVLAPQYAFMLSPIYFQDNYKNIKNELKSTENFIDIIPILELHSSVLYFGNVEPVFTYKTSSVLNSYLDEGEENISLYGESDTKFSDSYSGNLMCYYDLLQKSGNIEITEGKPIDTKKQYVHGEIMEVMVNERSNLPLNTKMYISLKLRDENNKEIIVPCQIVGKYKLNYTLPLANNSFETFTNNSFKKNDYIFIPNITEVYDITRKIGGEMSEYDNTVSSITLVTIYETECVTTQKETIYTAVYENNGVMLNSIYQPHILRNILMTKDTDKWYEYLFLSVFFIIIFVIFTFKFFKKQIDIIKDYKKQCLN